MPIVFGPAQPIGDASIGNAQAMAQNNSTIAGLMRAVAEAYQNRQNNSVRLSIADQQARQSGAETAFTQMARNQNERNKLDFENTRESGENATAIERAQIAADNQLELQNRKFTQADQIRKQKLEAGHAWVDAQQLTPEERQQFHAMINSQLTPLQVQESNSKQKYYKEKQDQVMVQSQLQANALSAQQSIMAKNKGATSGPVNDPKILQQVQDEYQKNPQFMQQPEAVKADQISNEVRRRGGQIGEWHLTPSGLKYEYYSKGSGKAGAEKPFDSGEVAKDVKSEADALFPMQKPSKDEAGNNVPADNTDRNEFMKFREIGKHVEAGRISPQDAAAAVQQHVQGLGAGNEFNTNWWNQPGRRQQKAEDLKGYMRGMPGRFSDQPNQGLSPGSGGQASAPNPEKIAASDDYKKSLDATSGQAMETIDAAGLPDEAKAGAKRAVQELADLAKKYPGGPPADSEDRKKWDALQQMLLPILRPKPPQAPQPQPIPGMISANQGGGQPAPFDTLP
jgi:hypothetical protein